MRVFVGGPEYKRGLFSRHATRMFLDQPGMHKYGRAFVPAAVEDEVLIGGNLFPVGVGRF